jgi:flagellar protein FlgJ
VTTPELSGPGFAGLSERAKLERAARELEAIVVTQLLSTMRRTVPDGGLLEKSATEDLFRSLLDGEMARVTGEKSPFGLAKTVLAQFENRFKEEPAGTEGPGESSALGKARRI